MSVQFAPPKGFGIAHLGVFWDILKEDFPNVTAVQPITPMVDDFGTEKRWFPQSFRLALSDSPDCRLQMTSADECWMCQIQQDRLAINWRRREEKEYPRYSATWDSFSIAWQKLLSLLQTLKLEPAKPQLWELLYVNQIPKGELWSTPQQWPDVFPGLWGNKVKSVAGADLFGLIGQWVWQTPDGRARTIVEPKPGKDVLFMTITTRGVVRAPDGAESSRDANSSSEIKSGLDLGHSLIVSTFDEIISDAAKKIWGRR